MANWESSPSLSGCVFTANTASIGGAMYNQLSTVTIVGSSFCDVHRGGGMKNTGDSDPLVIGCEFVENAVQGHWFGPQIGGEYLPGHGGGIYNSGGDPTVINCTFIGNSASDLGGGIYNLHGHPIVINCTFSVNSASNGQALAFHAPSFPGGGLGPAESSLFMANCILWDGGEEILNTTGAAIWISHSNIQEGWPGPGNIDADPMFLDPDNGDYRLMPGSPLHRRREQQRGR